MSSSKKSTFFNWLQSSKTKEILRFVKVRSKHIDKIKSEIFVANNEKGEPLCLFEVGRASNSGQAIEYKNFFLEMLPPRCLNLPGYAVQYKKTSHKKKDDVFNFTVKKFTPTERVVGEFNTREFAKFLATTISFCRNRHIKESAQCKS